MSDNYFKRYASLLDEIKAFNEGQFLEHGTTPKGVGWNSIEAQLTRFDQVLKDIQRRSDEVISLNDIGCGYGALLDYLLDHGHDVDYRGYDVSERTLAEARRLHAESSASAFRPLQAITPADYSVASGVFGLRLSSSEEHWNEYVTETLELFNSVSARGFAFNMLTVYSDTEKKRVELHYADPCAVFDLCKRKFSRNVALYHDYSLYDFTIVVRKT
jgi:SAM-dependent methyltransferase